MLATESLSPMGSVLKSSVHVSKASGGGGAGMPPVAISSWTGESVWYRSSPIEDSRLANGSMLMPSAPAKGSTTESDGLYRRSPVGAGARSSTSEMGASGRADRAAETLGAEMSTSSSSR